MLRHGTRHGPCTHRIYSLLGEIANKQIIKMKSYNSGECCEDKEYNVERVKRGNIAQVRRTFKSPGAWTGGVAVEERTGMI